MATDITTRSTLHSANARATMAATFTRSDVMNSRKLGDAVVIEPPPVPPPAPPPAPPPSSGRDCPLEATAETQIRRAGWRHPGPTPTSPTQRHWAGMEMLDRRRSTGNEWTAVERWKDKLRVREERREEGGDRPAAAGKLMPWAATAIATRRRRSRWVKVESRGRFN